MRFTRMFTCAVFESDSDDEGLRARVLHAQTPLSAEEDETGRLYRATYALDIKRVTTADVGAAFRCIARPSRQLVADNQNHKNLWNHNHSQIANLLIRRVHLHCDRLDSIRFD